MLSIYPEKEKNPEKVSHDSLNFAWIFMGFSYDAVIFIVYESQNVLCHLAHYILFECHLGDSPFLLYESWVRPLARIRTHGICDCPRRIEFPLIYPLFPQKNLLPLRGVHIDDACFCKTVGPHHARRHRHTLTHGIWSFSDKTHYYYMDGHGHHRDHDPVSRIKNSAFAEFFVFYSSSSSNFTHRSARIFSVIFDGVCA